METISISNNTPLHHLPALQLFSEGKITALIIVIYMLNRAEWASCQLNLRKISGTQETRGKLIKTWGLGFMGWFGSLILLYPNHLFLWDCEVEGEVFSEGEWRCWGLGGRALRCAGLYPSQSHLPPSASFNVIHTYCRHPQCGSANYSLAECKTNEQKTWKKNMKIKKKKQKIQQTSDFEGGRCWKERSQ